MINYVLKEMPDLRKTGKRNVFPKVKVHHTVGTEEFLKVMATYHHTNRPNELRAMVEAMKETIAELLADGHNVNIEGLGTFSLSLEFKDEKSKELQEGDDMLYRKVQAKDVNFRASRQLVGTVDRATEYVRDEEERVVKIAKSPYTKEERIARAVAFIKEKGQMRLPDYCALNELDKCTASKELQAVADDPAQQITTQGKGTHKCWVVK